MIGANRVWYKERYERGPVLENDKAKLVWDFQSKFRKTETAKSPDLILQVKNEKQIGICDMACPMQQSIDAKRTEKHTRYRQLAFATRKRRPGYNVTIVPVINWSFLKCGNTENETNGQSRY